MTSFGQCITEQLCSQCQRLQAEPSPQSMRLHLSVPQGSTCPLCCFFVSALHHGEFCATTKDTLKLFLVLVSTDVSGIPELFSLEIPGSDTRWSRFLLRLPICEGGAWEGSKSRRRDLCKWPISSSPIPYRRLHKDSINYSVLKDWIFGCQRMHLKHCAAVCSRVNDGIQEMPIFRLIDCRTKTITTAPMTIEYVALSYVWGRQTAENSSSENSPLQPGLPTKLPNTIEDAMKVTVSLGYRYLWVDKYCVDQRAEHSELQAQLATMDLIYSGACVTIIAAAGNDASFGLPGVGSRARIAHLSIAIDGITWVSGHRDTRALVSASTWATRGWVSFRPSYIGGLC
jgi:hypothetical protein